MHAIADLDRPDARALVFRRGLKVANRFAGLHSNLAGPAHVQPGNPGEPLCPGAVAVPAPGAPGPRGGGGGAVGEVAGDPAVGEAIAGLAPAAGASAVRSLKADPHSNIRF